jgi:hypothetical protein
MVRSWVLDWVTFRHAGYLACTAEVPQEADLIIAARPDVADDARCELWSVLIGSIEPILSAVNWSTVN